MTTRGLKLHRRDNPWARLYWHENGQCVCFPTQQRWGYGYVNVTLSPGVARRKRVHRYIYEQAYGPVSPRLDVCHSCDVRNCVRLSHLFVGKRIVNIYDAITKGRVPQLTTTRWVLIPT